MTPRRRRLVAIVCLVALVGAALVASPPGGAWALDALSPVLPGAEIVGVRAPAAGPSPPSVRAARDQATRAPPLA
jgi:hypothetical protein